MVLVPVGAGTCGCWCLWYWYLWYWYLKELVPVVLGIRKWVLVLHPIIGGIGT